MPHHLISVLPEAKTIDQPSVSTNCCSELFFCQMQRYFTFQMQNRYLELHRVKRQWQNMKERMEFGFGHKEDEPKEGELAHFCAGCPQAGINLPANWKDDPERWKYHRSYCGDGCFSQVHQASAIPEEDVWLKSGEGFMTERTEYAKHLASAIERKDVSVYVINGPTIDHNHSAFLLPCLSLPLRYFFGLPANHLQ